MCFEDPGSFFELIVVDAVFASVAELGEHGMPRLLGIGDQIEVYAVVEGAIVDGDIGHGSLSCLQ